jgi:hypothetical protein
MNSDSFWSQWTANRVIQQDIRNTIYRRINSCGVSTDIHHVDGRQIDWIVRDRLGPTWRMTRRYVEVQRGT